MANMKRLHAVAAVVMGAAMLTAAPTVFFAAGDAVAQTSPGAPYTAQGNISPTTDQLQSFVKSLESYVSQSLSGVTPNVGASVPAQVKTQPMPPAAAAAVPEVKDHHIVKADDQTILIVDPVTRQIVGVISASDINSTTGAGTPGGGSNSK